MTRQYYTCLYCGSPIKKFLIGWVHVNYGFPGIPTTTHVARPR